MTQQQTFAEAKLIH